jgi:1-aminocyclopropane-1-carboxylate deaminase/D-cysteine desulfhydrase-like pyridoxal-dependent ACC family enzyme
VTGLTPVELRNGRWYKREDLHTGPAGVNGAKLRACDHLIGAAARTGARRVVSAASVLSPQNAMAAVLARQYGLGCTVVVGGTSPRTAFRHRSMQIARDAGARFEFIGVGYNPALQSHARKLAEADMSAYWLRYGITPPPAATPAELEAFHWTAGAQVENLPLSVRTLVIPFGSGNTGAGVLLGLSRMRALDALRIVLVCIGPDRQAWLKARLASLGVLHPLAPRMYWETVDLHGSGYAAYGDLMPRTEDGIVLHPTYEGKVARYLDEHRPDWWMRRDGTTCLWIVGGPLG